MRSRRFRSIDLRFAQRTVRQVERSNGKKTAADSSPAPRNGIRLMIIILVALALLAIYANVQKARRDKIEKTTIIPVPSATSPAASPGR
jgi:hypothetical protein